MERCIINTDDITIRVKKNTPCKMLSVLFIAFCGLDLGASIQCIYEVNANNSSCLISKYGNIAIVIFIFLNIIYLYTHMHNDGNKLESQGETIPQSQIPSV